MASQRVLFIAGGGRDLAGSRIRAWQLADAWPDADCVQWMGVGIDCDAYDVVVVQKLHPSKRHGWCLDLVTQFRLLHEHGKCLIWDLCDAIWWWMPEKEFRSLAKCFDAIVVSNQGLQETLKEDYGYDSTLIRDRLPFQSKQKVHGPVEVPKLVWYGYSQNRAMNLNPVLFVLQRLANDQIPFKFRLIDEDDGKWKWSGDGTGRTEADWFEHVPWNQATFDEDLLACDIAVVPAYPGLWGHVKESVMREGHKAATASWLGLPVTDFENYKSLKRLLTSWEFRAEEGSKARAWAADHALIYTSVVEWQNLLRRLQHARQFDQQCEASLVNQG